MSPKHPTIAEDGQPPSGTSSSANAIQNFLAGAFLSGLPIFIYLELSVYMTHAPLAAVGWIKLGSAIAIPLFCGLLAAISRGKLTEVLSGMLESVNLPF